jgi:presenilin-like A22 family membrane protease
MKHNVKITAIIIGMFLLTQFIGIYVVDHYSTKQVINGEVVEVVAPSLPFGLETPNIKENREFNQAFVSILFAFVIAISLLLLLSKFNAAFFLKLWFFLVVTIALGISFNAFLSNMISSNVNLFSMSISLSLLIIVFFALILAYIKIYKKGFLIHNATELLIYPGIAAVFVPILNIYTIVFLLILISIYDMWAVWHSGIMQKMAKYQIDTLNIFSGFFIPYASKKVKAQMKKMKKTDLKKKKVRVNVAILGGGDVIFPIIAAGVMLKTLGLFSAILVVIGATLGLGYLLFSSEKKKFYPAMPFISAGIFLGIGLSYLLF